MRQYTDFAQLYDALMDDVDYDAWAAYLLELGGCNPLEAPRVADIACGTGSITLRLAKAGCRVTGVDLSEDMLRVAQQKAARAGLQIPFVRQDMRKLALHRPADLIICACDGVNYLPEGGAGDFFAAAFSCLKPGGRLLFDIRAPWELRSMDGQLYGEDRPDAAYLWGNHLAEHGRVLQMDLTFFTPVQGGLFRRFQEIHRMRLYDVDELLAQLTQAEFDASAYGFLTRQPPRGDEARIQFHAIRGAAK